MEFLYCDIQSQQSKIFSNCSNILLLTKDNKLFVRGSNYFGVLGFNEEEWTGNKFIKSNVRFKSPIQTIYACRFTTFILTVNNEVYASGLNNKGNLGLNKYSDCVAKFTKVKLPVLKSNIKRITSGRCYSFLLTEDGSLYISGTSSKEEDAVIDIYGEECETELNLNKNKSIFSLVNFGDDEKKVDNIFLGEDYHNTFLLMKDGSLYCCGLNRNGELGMGDNDCYSNYTKSYFCNSFDILDIKSGRSHTLLLLKDGRLYSCGDNKKGQLGLGDREDRYSFELVKFEYKIRTIHCQVHNSYLITEKGVLYGCGDNEQFRVDNEKGDKLNFIKSGYGDYILNCLAISDYAFGGLLLTDDGFYSKDNSGVSRYRRFDVGV